MRGGGYSGRTAQQFANHLLTRMNGKGKRQGAEAGKRGLKPDPKIYFFYMVSFLYLFLQLDDFSHFCYIEYAQPVYAFAACKAVPAVFLSAFRKESCRFLLWERRFREIVCLVLGLIPAPQ